MNIRQILGPASYSFPGIVDIFDKGLLRLYNAIILGKYDHGDETIIGPVKGAIQYDNNKLQLYTLQSGIDK
jgi:hypothetical protein